MPIENWNDLRYLLAVQRGRTLAAAARRMGVDDTTVARRLRALQAGAGTALFQRDGSGAIRLTPAGAAMAARAEAIEHQVALIGSGASGDDAVAGNVRITAVPLIANRLLAPAAGDLLAAHPHLRLELIPDSRDLSLTRREADLALRLARPKTGGTQVKARRLATLDFAAFARRGGRRTLPWISYDEAMAHLPQARWMAADARGDETATSGLRVHDAETAWEAAAAGLGRTLLPVALATRDRRLTDVAGPRRAEAMTRELWLLSHADQVGLARIAAVTTWLEALVATTFASG